MDRRHAWRILLPLVLFSLLLPTAIWIPYAYTRERHKPIPLWLPRAFIAAAVLIYLGGLIVYMIEFWCKRNGLPEPFIRRHKPHALH